MDIEVKHAETEVAIRAVTAEELSDVLSSLMPFLMFVMDREIAPPEVVIKVVAPEPVAEEAEEAEEQI